MKLKRRSAKPVDERREGSAKPPRERPHPLVAGLAVAEREVTPARAVAGLAVAAAILLAVSQFTDYREVRAIAHAFLPLAAAVATVVIVALAMLGRWRLARVLVFLGAGVIVISLAIDLPKGLDEGSTAIEFEGAEARLLGAFWVEILCGFVIAICGPLLARALSPASGRRARPQTARERSRERAARLGAPGVPEASS